MQRRKQDEQERGERWWWRGQRQKNYRGQKASTPSASAGASLAAAGSGQGSSSKIKAGRVGGDLGGLGAMGSKSALVIASGLVLLLVTAFALHGRISIPPSLQMKAAKAAQTVERIAGPGGRHPILTQAPLIGILTQEMDSEIKGQKLSAAVDENGVAKKGKLSYIAASYVKFVEMAGARAVPIFHNAPEEDLRERFNAVNGIIFPGGGASLRKHSEFFEAGKLLFDWTVEANDNDDYFPLHGTCLGFELLTTIVSKNHSILTSFEAEGNPAKLDFTSKAFSSNFFRHLPYDVLDSLSDQPIAMENHEMGLRPEDFVDSERLSSFFNLLSNTEDKEGNVYVSTVEAKRYPVTGTQWHPEKNTAEFGLDMIPHTETAIRMTQAVANYFVGEARASGHKPLDHNHLTDILIYNYPTHYSTKPGDFLQIYLFEGEEPWNIPRKKRLAREAAAASSAKPGVAAEM